MSACFVSCRNLGILGRLFKPIIALNIYIKCLLSIYSEQSSHSKLGILSKISAKITNQEPCSALVFPGLPRVRTPGRFLDMRYISCLED